MIGVIVALITIVVAVSILFLDKVAALFNFTKNRDSDLEEDFNLVMSEADNSGFYNHNE